MAKLTGAVAPKKDVVAAAKKKVDDLKAKAALAKQKKTDADAAALAAAAEADASDAEETAAEGEEAQDEALPDDEETDVPEEDVRPETPLTTVDPSMHMPDGVFDIPREEGDAPKSTLTVESLHPVALDHSEEEDGARDWVEPFPDKGVVTVRFTVETPIGRTWYRAGDVATIPAELAHSISKQITGVGS